jgi:hypothetical protein
MAVTAHWIEAVEVETMSGVQKRLELRVDLVGFHKLPGRHTGKHLAFCFYFILERLKMAQKVFLMTTSHSPLTSKQIGWITCDNASNNNTMMTFLQNMLWYKHKLKFDAVENRIRYG